LTFKPDGLQIWNLKSFHSAFEKTKRKYEQVVGANTPMMVCGFLGYKNQLRQARNTLTAAEQAGARAQAQAKIDEISQAAGANLTAEEQHLQALGYRGLGVEFVVLQGAAASQTTTKK